MQVGDKIPEIFGVDQDGKEIKASDYRGRKNNFIFLSESQYAGLHGRGLFFAGA